MLGGLLAGDGASLDPCPGEVVALVGEDGEAARRAGVTGVVAGLPGGYDARLGAKFTGGTGLSPGQSLGQSQRIVLPVRSPGRPRCRAGRADRGDGRPGGGRLRAAAYFDDPVARPPSARPA